MRYQLRQKIGPYVSLSEYVQPPSDKKIFNPGAVCFNCIISRNISSLVSFIGYISYVLGAIYAKATYKCVIESVRIHEGGRLGPCNFVHVVVSLTMSR